MTSNAIIQEIRVVSHSGDHQRGCGHICSEILGGFQPRLVPSVIVVVGYATSFYFLSLTLKGIPVGVAYAIWSGAGTALVTLFAWAFMDRNSTQRQSLAFC